MQPIVKLLIVATFILSSSPALASQAAPGIPASLPDTAGADGLYPATCPDGLVIRLRRYRPTPTDEFRCGRQPVLIFAGILEEMNQFLPSSNYSKATAKRYKNMRLRTPLADWARNDARIVQDPMLYFNLGYFLWSQGYDAWFVNYRGTGRGAYRSDRPADDRVTLDTWITLDTPAAIEQVVKVTGLKPFIGGHSTGGLVAYCYLQGVHVDPAELGEARGCNPHVKAESQLALKRNQLVRGVIALDPAAIAPLPPWSDNAFWWGQFNDPGYYRLEPVFKGLDLILTRNGTHRVCRHLFDDFHDDSSLKQNYAGTDEALNIWNTHDKHPYMSDWICYNVVGNTYSGCLGQYFDCAHNQTMREHWQNGPENVGKKRGLPPAAGDGYYYYNQHMDRVTAPFLTLLSHYDGLVKADQIIRDLMQAKTRHAWDKYTVLPNTGHMNVYEGYTASMLAYPLIDEWLRQVGGGPECVSPADAQQLGSRP